MTDTPTKITRQVPGTPDAIKFPPRLITLPPEDQDQGEGQLSAAEPARRSYTWQTCSRGARVVLEAMRRATPEGAAVPWRSTTSVTPIQARLDDGASVDDLLGLVEGAAELVARGSQDVRWWYPGNLFGERTVERWLADVAAMRQSQAEAAARTAELAAIEAELDRRKAAEPSPEVRSLELRRIYDALVRARGASEVAERGEADTR